MRFALIDQAKEQFPVQRLCPEAFGCSASIRAATSPGRIARRAGASVTIRCCWHMPGRRSRFRTKPQPAPGLIRGQPADDAGVAGDCSRSGLCRLRATNLTTDARDRNQGAREALVQTHHRQRTQLADIALWITRPCYAATASGSRCRARATVMTTRWSRRCWLRRPSGQDVEIRTGLANNLLHTRRCRAGHCPIHRRLLQPRAVPFRARLPQLRTVRKNTRSVEPMPRHFIGASPFDLFS